MDHLRLGIALATTSALVARSRMLPPPGPPPLLGAAVPWLVATALVPRTGMAVTMLARH